MAIRIEHTDYKCLCLLWKWKFLTTSALDKAAYKFSSIVGVYNRLLQLEKAGYIKAICAVTGQSYLWQLQDKGFKLVLKSLPPLNENGYKSENQQHDFFVTAIHAGEWLCEPPQGCNYFSEQELRRYDFKSYPEWVPASRDHRPDGWWTINQSQSHEKSLIALEVELSRKTVFAYEQVGEFYSVEVKPYQVVWVVKSEADMNYIKRHLASGTRGSSDVHSFILLSHYLEDQWQSKFLIGKNQGKSLAEILKIPVILSAVPSHAKVLLDTRKKPVVITSNSDFSDFGQNLSNRYLF